MISVFPFTCHSKTQPTLQEDVIPDLTSLSRDNWLLLQHLGFLRLSLPSSFVYSSCFFFMLFWCSSSLLLFFFISLVSLFVFLISLLSFYLFIYLLIDDDCYCSYFYSRFGRIQNSTRKEESNERKKQRKNKDKHDTQEQTSLPCLNSWRSTDSTNRLGEPFHSLMAAGMRLREEWPLLSFIEDNARLLD